MQITAQKVRRRIIKLIKGSTPPLIALLMVSTATAVWRDKTPLSRGAAGTGTTPCLSCFPLLSLSAWSEPSLILPLGYSLSLICHKTCLPEVERLFSTMKHPGHPVWATQGHTQPVLCVGSSHTHLRAPLWITRFSASGSAALVVQPPSDGCFNLKYHRYRWKWFSGGTNHLWHSTKTP